MEEQNQAAIPPETRARSMRVIDALDEIQATISAFQRYIQQPLALVCEHYWNAAVAAEGADIVVVPQAELLSYNPEPENPDSGAQLIHMPAEYEQTEANLAKFGIPMARVITPKYEMEIELTAVNPSDSTVRMIDSVLLGAVRELVRELAKMAKEQPSLQIIATPLQGAVVLNAECPERMGVYMYTLCGRRDAATLQPPDAA